MSEHHSFTGGEHVRLKPTDEHRSPRIGRVAGVKENSNIVDVEYSEGLGKRVTRPVLADKLEEMCRELVYRGYGSSECGRKAKENHLCGLHLSHLARRVREREAMEKAQRDRREKNARMLAVAELAKAEIEALFGGTREIEVSVTNITERARVSMDLDVFLDIIRNA